MRLLDRNLQWIWYVAALCALIGPAAWAAPDAPGAQEETPVLTASELVVDRGEVVEGPDVSYTFTLENHSEKALKLQVLTSCGCAVAKADPEIAAGGRSTLQVTLKTKGLRGRQNKLIVVQGGNNPKARLSLRAMATVTPLIRVEPHFATFVSVRDAGVTATQFLLSPAPGQGVNFTEVVSNAPYVKASLAPTADGPTRVIIWFTPDAPVGHLQATVTVVTNSPITPRLGLTVSGEKGISISPGIFFLGLVPANATSAKEEVTLRKAGGRFSIEKIECDDEHVRVTQEKLQDGTRYKLTATYLGGWPVGLVKKTVTVTTNDPRQRVLTIPLQAVVSAVSASAAAVGQ
jgi:hypothetical protein